MRMDESRAAASTPSSTTSGCMSGDSGLEENLLPSALAEEELQLALNKEATEEELQKAITRCKELVLACDQCSSERKWLVRHLIELRLRLQECQEALLDPQHPRNKSSGVSRRIVRGHHLQLQPLLRTTTSKYCDNCTGLIWSVVQAWYECEDCGYCCHHKCIASIIRECAHITVSERGGYELEICPEEGLSAQQYLCAECKIPLSVTVPKGLSYLVRLIFQGGGCQGRRCDYSGLYYCTGCHWGSLAVIPARVVHNWDFTPQPVSQASLQQLRVTTNRPLINLHKLNPRLFSLLHELDLVKRLRQDLHGMRKYLLVCRNAQEDHLLWKNVDIPHLIETTDLFSLQDLVNTQNGELITMLHNITSVFSNHIKKNCEICKGRGHICEICSNDEVLFPFDFLAVTCKDCNAVFHKDCLNRKKKCPKCLRIEERLKRLELDDDDCDEL